MKHCLASAGCIVAALACSAVYGQEAVRIDEGVTWLPAAQRIDTEILDRVDRDASPFDEEDLVILYRSVSYELSEHEVTQSLVRVFQFNSEEAVRDYGTLRLGFDAASDMMTITQAVLLDSQGEPHAVEPDTVQVVPSDTQNIFSDSRLVVLPMTGVDVGSIAIIAAKVTTDRSKDVAPWGTIVFEQFGVPQARIDLSIAWESPDLRPDWQSALEGMNCSESSEGSLQCNISNVPAYPVGDDFFVDDVAPHFVAAEPATWESVADWYSRVFDTALSRAPSVAAKAAELSAGLDDETEILKSVHEFVSRRVRYVGLEHGDSAYVPHSSELTLRRRFGDCKDMTALMIDLLHHAGIEMSPVLVASARRDPGKLTVPSVRYFDHLIACGTLRNGTQYCLDGTDPYTGVDQLSSWIQGAVALTVDDTPVLSTLPASPYQLALSENLEMSLDAAGALTEKGTLRYEGAYASNIRSFLTGLDNEQRHDWALEDYQNTVSGLVEPSFRFTGIDDANSDLEVSWDTRYEEIVDTSGDFEYVEDASWLDQSLGYVFSRNDDYEYRFAGLRFDSVVRIGIPAAWEISQWSADIDMRSRFGRLHRTVEPDGQDLVVRTVFEAPAAVIAVDEIEAFTGFLEIIQAENAWHVVGSKRADR